MGAFSAVSNLIVCFGVGAARLQDGFFGVCNADLEHVTKSIANSLLAGDLPNFNLINNLLLPGGMSDRHHN